MPISRKGSPRKSLKSLYSAGPGSMENAPPLPTHVHRFSPAPGAGPETARIQLSALSSSELNGGNRLPSITQSPAPSGFTAVNTGSFTPVNTTPPLKEPSRDAVVRDATREASKEAVGRPAVPTTDLRLLQCEVTAGLFTFFFPRATMPPDEAALLQRLHTLWFHGEALFRAELPTHYDLVSKILTVWLHERQAIAALRHSMASSPGATHAGLVDRLLAMNDLRAMRLKWKNMSPIDGLSPEDLLCMAFRAMTNTEGSEYLFKDGLARLELGVFEFLRNEDSRIVLQRRDTKAV
ncbi:GTPase SAR1 [Pyrenophora tritici-repentis]|nr:GTPase SAR1 [Pyrenophora tritici-repentis]